MKSTIAKAKKYESKESLNGAMKFLKGNVSKVVKSNKLGKSDFTSSKKK